MRAFKRRLGRLTTTFCNYEKWFTLTSGHGAQRRTGVPGLIIFWLYTPEFKKLWTEYRFFFQKMRRSFLVRYWKARNNQAISLLDICGKLEGRAKSAPPPLPGRGLMGDRVWIWMVHGWDGSNMPYHFWSKGIMLREKQKLITNEAFIWYIAALQRRGIGALVVRAMKL